MIYHEQINAKPVPTGLSKVFHLHWPLMLVVIAVCCFGFVMLYSVAGGSIDPWARQQMVRFGIGLTGLLIVAMTPVTVWRALTPAIYILALLLLVAVEFIGEVGMGAQRWIDLGFMRLQPSEVMKVALVMLLAQYYAWLDIEKVSRPLWVLPPLLLTALPVGLVLTQPDLGTAILLAAGGAVVMFLAGVSLWYWGTAIAGAAGLISAVFLSFGTSWQVLQDYQYRRLWTFLNPEAEPLGAGYHITQSKIALGSGGISGRGLTEGTQSRLDFLPEKHTDFIFTTLAEELGFLGGLGLLILYGLIIVFCMSAAFQNRDRFSALMIAGLTATFSFYFVVNIAMVMGLAPVVGVPLPLISYGGTAMLVLLGAFGLIQSAHIHRPRGAG